MLGSSTHIPATNRAQTHKLVTRAHSTKFSTLEKPSLYLTCPVTQVPKLLNIAFVPVEPTGL